MKKILIAGQNSYIGNSFEQYIQNNFSKEEYTIEKISLRGSEWRNITWMGYDAILYVTGIAHADTKKASDEIRKQYYEINTDLTIEVAEKAKQDGVTQFVFLSSMIVFGENSSMGDGGKISKDTSPNPSGFYGDSKLQAEKKLMELESKEFLVSIVRPPMVYGKGSKGNYPRLAKLAKKTFVFPNIENKRSMIYIENLCEFLRLIVEKRAVGYFHPQNQRTVSTTELVKVVAKTVDKEIWYPSLFNPILKMLGKKIGVVQKVFGSFYYDSALSEYAEWNYQLYSFIESIFKTEK